MYEQHFGLERPPFRARAAGPDVFVGPQTAATMAGLKKALQSQDAVILVSGPPGVGKSTVVGKALDAFAATHRSVRIGRMSLDGADALEFLLEELGMTELPRGTIRQFAAFREKLGQLETDGLRLVVVVEDGSVTGADTLAELEALTAADTGASGGAAIIVMGDQRLHGFLQDPSLTRLVQRARQHQEVSALSPPELRGYLAHCFRNAGRKFDDIFAPDAAVVIHELCKGTPRMANKLVDAVLDAAAASGSDIVSGKFIAEIGNAQFGLQTSQAMPTLAEAPVVPEPHPEPHPESEPELGAEPELQVDPTADDPTADDPVIVFSDEPPGEPGEDDVPDLIQDTLPDLEELAPELEDLEALTELVAENEPEPAPTHEPAAKPVPDWERDPTMAELRPDLEALEKAMAFAHGEASEDEPPILEPLVREEPEPPKLPEVEEIPEITLDNAIQERIENSRVDKPDAAGASEESSPAKETHDLPELCIPGKKAKKADQELELIAAELAKAKTLEDVDDKLAETLFGEEFNLVAAQVVASGRAEESANDGELSLFDTGAAQMAQAAGSPVTSGMSFDGDSDFELTVGAEKASDEPEHDPVAPARKEATPEPIEDQINTSMTQTLKALNVRPPISDPAESDDADDDDTKKGGFFSRFRRS